MSSTEPTNTDPANTDPNNQNTEPDDGDLKPHERQFKTERDEARGERDTAQERVTTLLTREAERLAGEHLENGPDWTIDGATLEDVTDDNGDVDSAKLKAVCDAVTAKRRGLAKQPPRNQQLGAGGRTNQNRTGMSQPQSHAEGLKADVQAGRAQQREWQR